MTGIRSMRLPTVAVLSLALALGLTGCTPKPAAETTTNQAAVTEATPASTTLTATLETARVAGQVAAAIEKEPTRVSAILTEHSMTAESYQALLYDIAADAALTEAYEAARAGS